MLDIDIPVTSKLHLRKHKNKQHAGHRYPCDKCNYVAGDKYILNTHIESQHFNIRTLCDQCEYSGNKAQVNYHKKPEGVRFFCDIFDYKATRSSN